MERNYWVGVSQQRTSRRRAIAAAGAGAAATALLAACGGKDEAKAPAGPTSALITRPEDTSKQAKRGGSAKWYVAEPASMEPHAEDLITLNTWVSWAYSNLIMEKPGQLGSPPEFKEFLPLLAESWELSPDKLTLTMRIRQDVKFHNKPPVNGRLMDVQDIVFSWERYARLGAFRQVYASAANPNAPIESIKATDNRTIVVKSAFPATDLLALLAGPNSARYKILPKETDSTFSPKGDVIGTGPFVLTNYSPSVGSTWKRHPEYFQKDRPYIDQIDAPFILEYASAIAQFQAGNLWTYAFRPGDLLDQKQRNPALLLYEEYPFGFGGGTLRFGWLPAGKSPFNDMRVRQAVSMSIDRDLFLDTFGEADKFKAAGIPFANYWSTSAYPGFGSFWWLDPQGKDFGPNAKYYQHNLTEAKRLMQAAGYGSGVDVKAYRIQQPIYGPVHFLQVAVLNQMVNEIGIRTTEVLQDYASEYIPKNREGHGQYEGMGHTLAPSPANDAVSYFAGKYYSKGGTDFLGFDVTGKADQSGDPKVDADVEKARREFDVEKRRAMIYDMQRYLAEKQYSLSYPGVSTRFLLVWPCVRNFQVEVGDNQRSGTNAGSQYCHGVYSMWIDDTQPPLKKV